MTARRLRLAAFVALLAGVLAVALWLSTRQAAVPVPSCGPQAPAGPCVDGASQ